MQVSARDRYLQGSDCAPFKNFGMTIQAFHSLGRDRRSIRARNRTDKGKEIEPAVW